MPVIYRVSIGTLRVELQTGLSSVGHNRYIR